MGRRFLKVTLPDGTVLEVADGASTADIAASISPGLARRAVAGRVTVNGHSETLDLNRSLPNECALTVLTASDDDPQSLFVLRHSAAHVMAEAICKLFPETRLVYGPPLEDGFYYDIDLPHSITPDDFPRIEEEMARIVKEDRPFCRYDMPRGEAMSKLKDEHNRYKVDNAERAEGDSLSFYVTGREPGRDFEDLCRGPHIPSTGAIKAFKVRQVSRSFYRGDVNDQPLQRVYGTAFFKKSSLDDYLKQLEEARRRDHRVIGKQLDLFHQNEMVGSGLVLWMPKGTIIRNELQSYLTAEMLKLGYELVVSPHIGQLAMYRTSGHYPYYEDAQYPAMFESDRGKAMQATLQLAQRVKEMTGEAREHGVAGVRAMLEGVFSAFGAVEGVQPGDELEKVIPALYEALRSEMGYLLKPMNCPHHIQLYAARPRSYRDLPVRFAEYGTVYRYEQSGEISGLTRVRGFTQDDAHLFCTAEQLHNELLTTVKLTRGVFEILGMQDYRVRVGLRDPASDKYIGSPENWAKAEQAIRAAVRESGIEFSEEEGEAAFYGPKIDFIVKDCIGRNWQLGTVQADYNLPGRFELSYIGPDNSPHRPIMVHRAPFGSMERFVGILIEHFAGAFPLWLSPVQVAVASVSEKSEAYARKVFEVVEGSGLRAVLDVSSEKIGPKKHRLRSEKINYLLVVGEKESETGEVNVNDRDGRSLGNMALDAFLRAARAEVDSKGRETLSQS
ncbi:MAG: threonine--tRNA ligase [Phycisphaerae bacterium]|nr:threonine--tRNA ligase [Phycisphaerae bacterium]